MSRQSRGLHFELGISAVLKVVASDHCYLFCIKAIYSTFKSFNGSKLYKYLEGCEVVENIALR